MPNTTPRDKALRDVGLAALCGHVKDIRESVGDLAEATAEGFEEADTILNTKQGISESVNITIPTSGWKTDSSIPGFPNCIDLSVPVILGTDVVEVNVAPSSTAVARAANFTNPETLAGIIRLRAKNVPTAAIQAQYRIIAAAIPETENAAEEEA